MGRFSKANEEQNQHCNPASELKVITRQLPNFPQIFPASIRIILNLCTYQQSVPSIMYQQRPKTSDKAQLFKENSKTVEERSETNHGNSHRGL
jgi:hypothetical protein